MMKRIRPLSSFSWEETPRALKKTFEFEGFDEASDFIKNIIPICRSLNHHPSITWTYNKVALSLSTHDQGDIVTHKDHALAQAIDQVI